MIFMSFKSQCATSY